MPIEFDGCANPHPEKPDQPPGLKSMEKPKNGVWKIQKLINVVIDVPGHDADSSAAAAKFADEIANGLPLKVTLGDVVLPARFIN